MGCTRRDWPAVIDRAVLGVPHLFRWFPIDGQVVFDPEGIISTWPACFNILLGALSGIVYARGDEQRPAPRLAIVGAVMMVAALLLQGICPITKNIWTSTFAIFTGGFCLMLLAYIICFQIAPLIDANRFGPDDSPLSLRAGGQQWFEQFFEPRSASLAFGLRGIACMFAILVFCHRKRWILNL